LLLVSFTACANLLERDQYSGLLAWMVVAGIAASWAWPRRRKGTLAGLGFSLILLITTALVRALDFGTQSLLIVGLAVILQVAALLEWLRRIPPTPGPQR
jgi:hypothetical protein